jgi:hypothetical protein
LGPELKLGGKGTEYIGVVPRDNTHFVVI